jgi:hypothetical protein
MTWDAMKAAVEARGVLPTDTVANLNIYFGAPTMPETIEVERWYDAAGDNHPQHRPGFAVWITLVLPGEGSMV